MATINGTSGNDVLFGRPGADTLSGGNGSDTYLVTELVDTVVETNADRSSGGIDIVHCYVQNYTLPANVENGIIYFSGFGAFTSSMTGNALDNVITANGLNNRIDGGAGSDTVSYEVTLEGVTVRLGVSGPQVIGSNILGSGTDTLISIENVIGGGYNDKLFGSSGANRLVGGGGNDLLDGGPGADTMVGGVGDDTYYVRDLGDRIIEAGERFAGSDTVQSYLSAYTMASNVETGRIMSTGVANLTGNGLSNTLVAGAGSNKFDGAAGRDTVDYSRAAAGVSANLASGAAQATGGSGRDTFVSIENLSGSAFADRLSGNSGANVLVGLNGNDTIAGAAGNDTLTGGAGKDAFLFNTLPGTTNVDTLTDFRIVDDTILLENGVFVALSVAGTVSEDQFRSGLGVFAVDANDHLLYELSNGGLYYDADGNGAMPAELFARFARPADLSDSVPLLTASDIFIV